MTSQLCCSSRTYNYSCEWGEYVRRQGGQDIADALLHVHICGHDDWPSERVNGHAKAVTSPRCIHCINQWC